MKTAINIKKDKYFKSRSTFHFELKIGKAAIAVKLSHNKKKLCHCAVK